MASMTAKPLYPLHITRISAVNALGVGCAQMRAALRDERCGLAPCNFETASLDTFIGRVAAIEHRPVRADLPAYDCRNNRLAQLALESDGFEEAVRHAAEKYGASRIGVFIATSTSGMFETELAYRGRDPQTGALPPTFHYAENHNTYSVGDFVRRYCGLEGAAFVVASACSGSAKVFGNAARMIAAGVCDAAVVGGVDTLCLTTLHGFSSLGVMSREPCRPFAMDRDGISIGEGAGFALLERPEPGMQPLALLLGVGESSDAYHMSAPHPAGAGAILAMQHALDAAGLRPAEVDYVNLHGTGTRANDAAEDKALYELFGSGLPCSSTKGATGHLLGAAGITEAIVSVLAMQMQLIPAGLNTRELDPSLRSRYVLENSPATVERVLSNSFGFGGTNCSVVLGQPS